MKKRFFLRIVAMLLCISMVSTTVQAAPRRGGTNKKQSSSFWKNNQKNQKKNEQEKQTGSDSEVTVVEDENTVENGDILRAATYALGSSDGDVSTTANTSSTVLKYFPVTMYDYDTDTINNATAEAEKNATGSNTIGQGIYFSDGTPTDASDSSADMSAFVKGQYYIEGASADDNLEKRWVSIGDDNATLVGKSKTSATLWTVEKNGNKYYIYTTVNGTKYYMSLTSTNTSNKCTTSRTEISISEFSGDNDCVQLSGSSTGYYTTTTYYLNQWGGGNSTSYGAYNVENDNGNKIHMYLVTEENSDGTLVTPTYNYSKQYAAWNYWNKKSGENSNGNTIYTGLVESELNNDKDPVFTKPEGGIFDSDNTSVKSIYTNVEMPFVYDSSTGSYSFDASKNGVYFHKDTAQKSSGTAGSDTRLYFAEGATQKTSDQNNGNNYGDGSSTVWAPFDDQSVVTNMNYHFGMRATIPFTMTSNGRMNENNDNSTPITFSFSGDDDVWVFIDGQLVIDLGGIHNRLDATINFADNTITYAANNNVDKAIASYNDQNFQTTQTLFENKNNISQDRETFAATDTHELTIFYLERGKGASNCKIEFNLPMKDTVTVTKRANKSWTGTDGEEGTTSPLTEKEQATVDMQDFGFTLYKSTDGDTYDKVSNTKYKVLDKDGQITDTRSTDADGHFSIKNNQSARFVTTFLTAGTSYYVVEDDISKNGYVTPDYNFSGVSAGGFTYVKEDGSTSNKLTSADDIGEQVLSTNAKKNASYKVTVYGSDEAQDSLVFVCENYLDAKLPNPAARPAKDEIVIDYGLGVEIDALANDLYRGDNIELVSVTGAGMTVDSETGATISAGGNPLYGEAEIKDGKIQYQLTKQLTGTEVLTYKVKVTSNTTDEGGTSAESYEYATANVYIYPATVMYYEENFSDMVTYTDGTSSGWKQEGKSQTAKQEPGVVGTGDDSTYGSDKAYLDDSGDSNGSSMYVYTKSGAAQFSYTFTGTGTSFYVRTTENSGYMRVIVKDSSGNTVQSRYRDTVYLNQNGANIKTLYNIPIFTTDKLSYGTYTVTVTVAKGTKANGYGTDFWLDGIRVYQPLGVSDACYKNALSAYATDGEANMTNVTLRNKLIREANYVIDDEGNKKLTYAGDNFVVLTDNNGTVKTVEEYISDGPKEEVYLYDGQSVTFSLSNWDANSNKLYLGLKAPSGNATVTIGSKEVSLKNAADCYYEISNYGKETTDKKVVTFTITAGSKELVSVTNIKVTGNAEFTIIEDTNINIDGSEGEGSDVSTT